MRDCVPSDDGLEPTDFDTYYDVPAQTAKDVAVRFYIKVERDPKRATVVERRQNEAILQLLRWIHDNREDLKVQGYIPHDS